jgi:magnesium-transporting ATPase (P-type)
VFLVAVIITVAIFRGDKILTTLQFALVLTVAAIPVAMPTVLSVTMAVGARLLAKKKAMFMDCLWLPWVGVGQDSFGATRCYGSSSTTD